MICISRLFYVYLYYEQFCSELKLTKMRILKYKGVEYKYGFDETPEIEDKLKKASDSELLQWYYNAYVTYSKALGHHKTECNRELKEVYATELDKRKVFYKGMDYVGDENPGNFSKHNTGVFNGDGSY